jgi:hypothetical protein
MSRPLSDIGPMLDRVDMRSFSPRRDGRPKGVKVERVVVRLSPTKTVSLSMRQAQGLAAIDRLDRELGRAPTQQEVADAIGVNSRQDVQALTFALLKCDLVGYRDERGRWPTRVLPDGKKFLLLAEITKVVGR